MWLVGQRQHSLGYKVLVNILENLTVTKWNKHIRIVCRASKTYRKTYSCHVFWTYIKYTYTVALQSDKIYSHRNGSVTISVQCFNVIQ